METKRSLNEALFRAHPANEKGDQPQDKLFSMTSPDQSSYMSNAHQAPLNESHINLMQSWMNLRGLDCELAENKYGDMNIKHES